jgi:hypothetical protein
MLYLMRAQEVKRVPSGMREYTFFYGKGNENHEFGMGLFVHKRIISAVKRIDSVSDRITYIILRGCWFQDIVLNVHPATKDKTGNVKHRFYEKLEQEYDKFSKYHMNTLLGDFNDKVGRK